MVFVYLLIQLRYFIEFMFALFDNVSSTYIIHFDFQKKNVQKHFPSTYRIYLCLLILSVIYFYLNNMANAICRMKVFNL